jgi:hypothetical protein
MSAAHLWLGYSARDRREGAEAIFFSNLLRVSPLKGPFRLIRGSYTKKKDNDLFNLEGTQRRFEAALRGARTAGKAKPPPQQKPGLEIRAGTGELILFIY